MSAAECAAFGQGQGCGLLWSWDAAAKAVWYNLLDGVGREHAEGDRHAV